MLCTYTLLRIYVYIRGDVYKMSKCQSIYPFLIEDSHSAIANVSSFLFPQSAASDFMYTVALELFDIFVFYLYT